QVSKGRRRRGIGDVVCLNVDRLHRSDRSVLGRGDALLQIAHLGCEGRLIADGARHAAKKRRDLRASLRKPEYVVDEDEHVGVLDVSEILGDRKTRESNSETRARWLVHLTVDQSRGVDDSRLFHLQIKIVAFAGSLTDATEHRFAAV